jgi:hypothetical protein
MEGSIGIHSRPMPDRNNDNGCDSVLQIADDAVVPNPVTPKPMLGLSERLAKHPRVRRSSDPVVEKPEYFRSG